MIAGNNHIDKDGFSSLYPSACEKVFTKENIYGDFAGAAIKPLDKERVLSKITLQMRTPTPPLLTEGSISPAFQTPQNTRQLYLRIHDLQRSLNKKRQLSSSPVSHLQHLEKSAQMAMDMNILLHQEIKILQAENERKIMKKARRRGNLGQDTMLSIQEGQERIQQLDIVAEAQVEADIQRPRQRAPPRCSSCGTIGHIIRSCPSK